MTKKNLHRAASNVRSAGRHGDNHLVHINDDEFEQLRRLYGDPLINPATGIPEWGFFSGLKKAIGKIAPVLSVASLIPGLQFLSPLAMAGKATAALTGLGATASGVLGGAALGGLTGGTRGAATGALGGFLSTPTASGVSPLQQAGAYVLPNASEATQLMLGRGAVGAGMAAVNKQDPLKGALSSVLTGGVADKLAGSDLVQKGLSNHSILQQGALGAARGIELAGLTGGDPVKGALYGGGSGAALSALRELAPDKFGYAAPAQTLTGDVDSKGNELYTTGLTPALAQNADFTSLLNTVSSQRTKQDAMLALEQQLGQSPDQRPIYDALGKFTLCDNADDFGTCLSQNWDKFKQSISQGAPKMATGGAVYDALLDDGGDGTYVSGVNAGPVSGPGDGQDDLVDAKLSPGEYVFSADVVSALGSGSTEAGSRVLDKMAENIRRDYRSAPPGKLPPKAKSPLDYLRGAL